MKDLEYYKEHIEECPVDILRVLYAEVEADLYAANQIISEQIDNIKELEEENEGLKLDRRNLLRGIERITQTTPLNMRTETNYSINIDNNTIPKSKIKEKIEEVKMTSSQINGDYFMNNYKTEVLQELMEDK